MLFTNRVQLHQNPIAKALTTKLVNPEIMVIILEPLAIRVTLRVNWKRRHCMVNRAEVLAEAALNWLVGCGMRNPVQMFRTMNPDVWYLNSRLTPTVRSFPSEPSNE